MSSSFISPQFLTVPSTPYEALIARIHASLAKGSTFNNPQLTKLAEECFGGSRGAGRYTPKDAYDAMETAANLYLLEFGADATRTSFGEALRWLRQFTGQMATQVDRTQEQQEYQQFSTPHPMGFLAARLLAPQPGDCVLEPEAGTGNLATWARIMGASVAVNELAERRLESLRLLGFTPTNVDAEHLDDLLPEHIRPHGILMNPPFSSTAGRLSRNDPIYGARHVDSALRRLEAEGRLVAVVASSMAIGASKFREWWQRIARTYNVRANLTIGGKEFAKMGTTVDTQLIVIDKDGATPGATWADQLKSITFGSVETVEQAWEKLKHLAERVPRAAPDEEEKIEPVVFAPYVVRRLHGGPEHPADIVEAASMAAVMPPPATYRPHLPLNVITDKKLSIIQLENIVYAGQRHEQRLPNGARGGFMVGSGTGVGKGRILAGIIYDNWNQGRRRALWLSVNNDLMPSTKRDLHDIGAAHIPLARINDYQADDSIRLKEGVLFASFSSLISKSKKGRTRLEQIQEWLGTDGVVVIDEASKAKNAIGSGRGSDGTQTGQAVIDLQNPERNPEYRFVYASATGATDVRNMAYMSRFGLWGPGTAFPDGFTSFLNQVEGGGTGAMEMVARELKSYGLYLSGSISFGVDPVSGKAVEYSERINKLTEQQREIYDCAARAWQHVLQNINAAIEVSGGGKRARSAAMTKFWGEHQRFFNQLITAFNVPACIDEATRALNAGESVVISLVSTGEARTRDQVAKAVAAGDETLEDLDFSCREVISQMVDRGFPTVLYQDVEDPVTGRITQEVVTDANGNPVQCRAALQMKEELLTGLSTLKLPENPLDQIINHFGEEAVAELTGRTRRLIRDKLTNKVVYKKRAPQGIAMANVNIHEMEQFQAGRKRIAVISGAASMGISLHASRQCANQQRRCHITLQLGWSADVQMQTFGRTHRSDQVVPPRYVLMVVDLGGGRRFCSTIAKRLESLGALTKGDRSAASSGDMAKYNFETEEGRSALTYLFHTIMRGDAVLGLEDPKQTLRDMGLLVANPDGVEQVKKEDQANVPRFLNRVLSLDVDRQNALFDYYSSIFDRAVAKAKELGTFDAGVADIKALAIRLAKPPRVLAVDEVTGASTTLYTLDVDKAVKTCSFTEAEVERARAGGSYYWHEKKGYVALCVPSRMHTSAEDGSLFQMFAIWRPEGPRVAYRDQYTISNNYRALTVTEAEKLWTAEHDALPKVKTSRTVIISGAILPIWNRLRAEQEARLRVVRVTTENGQRIVGAEIQPGKVGRVLQAIGVSQSGRTPQEVFEAVLSGERVELVSGAYLFRVKVHGDVRLELGGVRYGDYALLERAGMIKELIRSSYYLFVPNDPVRGPEVMGRLLQHYPLLKTKQEVAESLREINDAADASADATAALIETAGSSVDVRQLIVPVEPVIPLPDVEPEPVVGSVEWIDNVVMAVSDLRSAEEEAEGEEVTEAPEPPVVEAAAAPPPRATLSSERPATPPPPAAALPVEYNKHGQGLLF